MAIKGALAVSAPVAAAYAAFAALAFVVHHFVAEGAYSAILTMSAVVQCFGISVLSIQVVGRGSAEGISAGALTLDAFAFVFRLSSTTWLNGYLPVDVSGDYVYQAIDLCSLLMVLWLLHRVVVVHRGSYMASEDSFPVIPSVLTCLGLAALLHGDLDDHPLFDTLWMAGLFAGVVAVLPQLWLITRTGGCVEALTSHYIAALALSRVLSGLFMWEARDALSCVPWFGSFNHALYAILGAHALHLFLLGDFMYYYVLAAVRGRLDQGLRLSGEQWV